MTGLVGEIGLASGQIEVGDSSNKPFPVAPLDCNLTNAGVLTGWTPVTLTFSSANLLACYDTPVLALAAPPAGYFYYVSNYVAIYTYVSANYAAGGVLRLQYGNTNHGTGTTTCTMSTNLLTGSGANNRVDYGQSSNPSNVAVSVVSGVALYLTNATAAFTTGDGTLKVYVKYRLVKLS